MRVAGATVPLATLLLSALILGANQAAAPPTYPALTVTIHRLTAVDPIEGVPLDEADWYYHVGVDGGGGYQWQSSGNLADNVDDLIVDRDHTFQVQSVAVSVAIMLCEDDVITADDMADISNDTSPEQNDIDCSPPPSGTLAGTFVGTWNLSTDLLTGGGYDNVTGYFQASGDSDGSTMADENDANLQFLIQDNYGLPGADAGGNIDEAHVDELLTFNATASTASQGSSILTYDWDFGDGRTSRGTSPTVTHRYLSKARFTVTLWVNDSLGMSSQDAIAVNVVNRAPEVSFVFSPPNPAAGEQVEFLDTSRDPDGTISSRLWAFGDGGISSSSNPNHVYGDNGNYTVTLTLTDNDGAANSTSSWVNVSNVDPVASFTVSPLNPEVGNTVAFTDTSSDPDGDVVAWSWDFGDGDSSSNQNPTHVYGEAGEYEVVMTVTDDDGGTDAWNRSVAIGSGAAAAAEADWLPAILLLVVVPVLLLAVWVWRRYSKGDEGGV